MAEGEVNPAERRGFVLASLDPTPKPLSKGGGFFFLIKPIVKN
jgi:hypothetical protein